MRRELAFLARVGADAITSPNGLSAEMRRNLRCPICAGCLARGLERLAKQQPRFPHRARHHTDTVELDMRGLWPIAAAHRHDQRTNSPRRSSPARDSAADTTYDSSGLLATTTFAPGTITRIRLRPQARKNCSKASRSVAFNTVKRGNGDRLAPSKLGGIRQMPPRRVRSLPCSTSEYSTKPYGGSVTTAWIELASWRSSHSCSRRAQAPSARSDALLAHRSHAGGRLLDHSIPLNVYCARSMRANNAGVLSCR